VFHPEDKFAVWAGAGWQTMYLNDNRVAGKPVDIRSEIVDTIEIGSSPWQQEQREQRDARQISHAVGQTPILSTSPTMI